MKRKPFAKSAIRGAMFVEAAIVISLLTLGLLGLIFFRDYYVKHLKVSRLARASVIAHSMTGCGNETPGQWIGTRDLEPFEASGPRERREPANAENREGAASSGDSRATSILGDIGGTTSDGSGIINPMMTSEVTGESAVTTSSGFLDTSRRRVFENDVRSQAHVSCGDPVREGDFEEAIGYIRTLF